MSGQHSKVVGAQLFVFSVSNEASRQARVSGAAHHRVRTDFELLGEVNWEVPEAGTLRIHYGPAVPLSAESGLKVRVE